MTPADRAAMDRLMRWLAYSSDRKASLHCYAPTRCGWTVELFDDAHATDFADAEPKNTGMGDGTIHQAIDKALDNLASKRRAAS